MRLARHQGMSLIELLVAMALGLVLIAAALSIYAQSRATDRVNETVARIQEQGRYALSVIEADAELAGFYGFTNVPETFRLIAGGNSDSPLATAMQMRQTSAPIATLPVGAHVCGGNYALDVAAPVQGSNGIFEMGPGRTAGCDPYSSGASASTDTLTIRRAETRDAAPEAGRLQIFGSRLNSLAGQFLFADGNAPGALDANHRVLNLVVRAYYIARDSVSRPGFPALRVKSLTRSGGSIAFDEDEVMTGIEDMQVQFGIDTGDYDNDGRIDPGADANRDGIPEAGGKATRYVAPDFPTLNLFQVVAVRVWLRVRADEPETGFSDERTYRYADVVYTPAGADRAYRRALISRTIVVRNARHY